MNKEWSLKELYSGYEDKAFQAAIDGIDEKIEAVKQAVSELTTENAAAGIKKVLLAMEEMNDLAERPILFCSLMQSANTMDADASAYIEQIYRKLSESTKAETRFREFVAQVPELEELIASDELLTEYTYFLKKIKQQAGYVLSAEVEEVISKLDLSGGLAWSNLQSYLTSTVKVDYKGEEMTLSAIRNMAYDEEEDVRREAYEAELACYDKIRDSIAFSLNSIKQQVLTLSEMRGYESPLDMTLKNTDMKRETLDAMFTAMKEFFPKFHQYLKRKGELLGHKNGLPWYDLFAPMGNCSRSFTTQEARDYLVELFSGFAPDLADMVSRAFEDSWIDFYPRKGKVGGAFCCNIQYLKQSRILTNFDGTMSDVVTLAHELGHAYHNTQIHGHRALNTEYSMPVAETASTFNETVVMDAAIDSAVGKEKIALLESQLQDVTQIICDIYSRYLFESTVFEKKGEGFLFPEQLEKIMLEAQKEAYGDGLDPDTLHPYMWVCKGHYYSAGSSFYNFPYAFGGLFARGLYTKYKEEGADFLPKYRALLHATPVCSVEEAAQTVGIDLTKPDFFRKSLQSYADRIDEFLELTK